MQFGSNSVLFEETIPQPPTDFVETESEFPWFAVRTRSNFENLAAVSLEHKGFKPYLPTYRNRRRWSDRVVVSDTPLFKGYVFCRFYPLNRLPIVTAHGVIGIVSYGTEPAPIDEKEIGAVQNILQSGLATEPCPFLREGQSVRVVRGALTGVDGVLVKKKSDFRLVISVTMLQRSVSVEIERDWVIAC
jgi:transcription antitermination factor NusG